VIAALIDRNPDFNLALRRAVRRAYGLDQMPSEQQLLQIAERWRPYRSLAVMYLFASEYEAQEPDSLAPQA